MVVVEVVASPCADLRIPFALSACQWAVLGVVVVCDESMLIEACRKRWWLLVGRRHLVPTLA